MVFSGDTHVNHHRQQAVQQVTDGEEQAQGAVAAALSPTPRDLCTLWTECTTGIGGRKAARLFTPRERGANKHKCSRRKVAWDTIASLVRAGHTSERSCDLACEVCGVIPVTRIINSMRTDKRNNTLDPRLTV